MVIGLVGHPEKVNSIKETLEQIDSSLNIRKLEITEIPELRHIKPFQKLQMDSDIVIISGYYDYLFFSLNCILKKVTGYIPRDLLTLYKTFLEGTFRGHDIFNISLDGYDRENVIEVYQEIQSSIDEKQLFTMQKAEVLSPEYVEKLTLFHLNNYQERHVNVCITCISLVFERLKLLGVPALLVKSTAENIRQTYERLRMEYLLKTKEANEMAIMSVEVEVGRTELEDDYQIVRKKLLIAEKIFLFSHRLQAAIEEIHLGKYIIITHKSAIERITHSYRSIELIHESALVGRCRINIGIGVGSSARDAGNRSDIALSRARKHEESCAFIIYDSVSAIGPVTDSVCDSITEDERDEEQFAAIAAVTGLSFNTLYKLHLLTEKYKSRVFTVNELSLLYGISLRSMYRIIERLETNGYVKEKGKRIVDGSGRPSRIIQIDF